MIGGPGYPLPYPSNPFPQTLPNASSVVWSNQIYMLGGEVFTIPPGVWLITAGTGLVTAIQALDPVTGMWFPIVQSVGYTTVNSDGSNYRVANLSGMPVGSTITAAGTGYIQATTTIVPSAGGSVWTPIIGGAVNSTVTIGTDAAGHVGGANFTLAPLLVVQAPPVGGIPATMSCTVSAGVINAVTVRAAGAGYRSPPGVLVLPNPLDPNFGIITVPTLTTTLTGAGTLTGIILANAGAAQGSTPTLAVGGAGSGATATVVMFSTTPTANTIFLQLLGGTA